MSAMLCLNTQAAWLPQQKTIDNLNAAYGGETNANHRYTLFAQKADEFRVSTTKENLEAAIKGESYERDSMYPEFLSRAQQDKAAAAVRSFTFALNA
jgi:rubrerythrin